MAKRSQQIDEAHDLAIAGSFTIPTGPPVDQDHSARSEEWQKRAWQVWHRLGEVRFPTSFLARQSTRLTWDVVSKGEPLDPDMSLQLIDEATEGIGEDEASRLIVLNLLVAGEGYYIEDEAGFKVYSIEQKGLDKKVKAAEAAGLLAPRFYDADPTDTSRADSSIRTALDPAEELLILTALSRAQSRSRIAQAGMLLTPSQQSFAAGDPFGADFEAAMMAGIKDERSPAAMVPIHVTMDGDLIEKVKHIQIKRDYDEKVPGKIDTAIKRIALAMDVPASLILGIADLNHWCADDETEVLTVDGWKRHDTLAIGDTIRTLNHESGVAQWQVVEDIYRADVVDEPMISLESGNHSSLTTSAHRWPVYDAVSGKRAWKTSETLASQDRVYTAAPSGDLPEKPTCSDELVELVGWLWTEGNLAKGGGASISQSHTRNPERVGRIRGALTRQWGPGLPSLRAGSRSLGFPAWREKVQENTSSFGGPITVFYLNSEATAALAELAPGKRPSYDFVRSLTAAQLELFIDVSCQADGRHYRSGRLDIWQRRLEDLAAFEFAMILSGRTTVLTEDSGGYNIASGLAGRSKGARAWTAPVKAAQQRASSATRETTPYTGTIWCPTTKNGTWLARRHGRTFYTGNSAWLETEETYNAHLGPTAAKVADVFAFVIEQKHPELAPVDVLPDPSAILARRSTVRDALDAYTATPPAVSAAYVREVMGATDDDAPTPEELARLAEVSNTPREPLVAENPGPPVAASLTAPTNNPAPMLMGALPLAIEAARSKVGAKLRTKMRGNPDAARLEKVPNAQCASVCSGHLDLIDVDATILEALSPFMAWWEGHDFSLSPREARLAVATHVKETLTSAKCEPDADLLAALGA